MQREPRNGEALLNRGVALAALERHAEALRRFRCRAQAGARPSGPASTIAATRCCSLARHAEAIAAFDRTLAAIPAHARAWNNRGRALQALNRHAEAAESFGKAIALQKDYADAHFNLALALLTLGDLRPASSNTNGAGSAAA